MYITRSELAC